MEESTYSRLIRDEITRQASLLRRRITVGDASPPLWRIGPVTQEDADIKEKRALGLYEAMRAGMRHDRLTKTRIEAEKRLELDLARLAKIDGGPPSVEGYDPKKRPPFSYRTKPTP